MFARLTRRDGQMDGLQDETKQIDEVGQQQAAQRDDQDEAAQASAAAAGGGAAAQARADCGSALKERDARIAELESEIAEAAKTAEGAEKPRAEMDELRRRGDEERVGFELQLAGAAGADESTQMSRWRKIAGLPESEE